MTKNQIKIISLHRHQKTSSSSYLAPSPSSFRFRCVHNLILCTNFTWSTPTLTLFTLLLLLLCYLFFRSCSRLIQINLIRNSIVFHLLFRSFFLFKSNPNINFFLLFFLFFSSLTFSSFFQFWPNFVFQLIGFLLFSFFRKSNRK